MGQWGLGSKVEQLRGTMTIVVTTPSLAKEIRSSTEMGASRACSNREG